MSVTYKAMYKCRLCGKLYESEMRTGYNSAIKATNLMFAGRDYQQNFELPKNKIHYCDDDSMGVADFVGWQEEEEKIEPMCDPEQIPF